MRGRRRVDLLVCPQATLGGLADDAATPHAFALRADTGQLDAAWRVLPVSASPLSSGFTEMAVDGSLYNSAVLFAGGKVCGIYR